MTELNFYLSSEDMERLFAVKDLQGKEDLTGNQFAKELLERELKYLFPEAPKYDEAGELLNANCYRG